MATEIKYNGSVIASPEAGQTATLKCRGMVMADDVVMEVADIEPPNIQPLTITEDGTYTAQDGVDGYSPVVVTAAEAERSRFWDINQNYGNRVDYSYSYAWDAYTDENFHPKYKFGNGSDLNLNGCFWGAKRLTNIPQILHSKSWTNMTNTFKNCNALVEVRFDGQIGNSISFAESSLLSKESVESVISHLYDSASGKTATFNSASRNKFTDAEWNALIATKPNWTISLA